MDLRRKTITYTAPVSLTIQESSRAMFKTDEEMMAERPDVRLPVVSCHASNMRG